MGDVFLEQLVKKKNIPADYLKKALILSGGLLVFLLGIYCLRFTSLLAPILLLVAAGGVYFAWYFITGLNLEFEYIYTNGEIDFDKISAKRKRKRIVTLRISSFDEFGEYDYAQMRDRRFDTVIDASVCRLEPGNYYAVYKSKDGKQSMIIFTPNERLLGEINKQYRRHATFNQARARIAQSEE